MPQVLDETQSISYVLQHDRAETAAMARYSAEEQLRHYYMNGRDPRAVAEAVVSEMAEIDAAGDLAADIRLGFTHTEAEAEEYRAFYLAEYLASWRDPELHAKITRARAGAGVLYVCRV